MTERKASDLFVECLEAEGVRHVFGIPGEETRRGLDLDVPPLIVLTIDYSRDVAISEELGTETVAA